MNRHLTRAPRRLSSPCLPVKAVLPSSDPCSLFIPVIRGRFVLLLPISGILVTKVFSPFTFFLTLLPNRVIPELAPPTLGERHFALCKLFHLTPLFLRLCLYVTLFARTYG